jgi:hypothetical protein
LIVALQVEKDASGKYVEVGTGEAVEKMQRRYILNASIADFTRDVQVNLFNEQAEQVLGVSADQLHNMKVCSRLHDYGTRSSVLSTTLCTSASKLCYTYRDGV